MSTKDCSRAGCMILRTNWRESSATRWKLSSYSPGSGRAEEVKPYTWRAIRSACAVVAGGATRASGIMEKILNCDDRIQQMVCAKTGDRRYPACGRSGSIPGRIDRKSRITSNRLNEGKSIMKRNWTIFLVAALLILAGCGESADKR